jgi:hypothetical protein
MKILIIYIENSLKRKAKGNFKGHKHSDVTCKQISKSVKEYFKMRRLENG